LYIELELIMRKQDCKISTVWRVPVGGGLMKEMKMREHGGWASCTYTK
jgi:hypothetical protein